ncbi:hypothetical protein B0T20DRAFT_51541 [Sordaria brevicollis]|uniref:Uncharacterized protein n=1 Tax=Sordaria brevicollis TaxID=83679 RepID=A0AAE0P2M4_SORBR|nr:hypothetical protein B0T20DRAFT_51541 [Sordaria brevicollis]
MILTSFALNLLFLQIQFRVDGVACFVSVIPPADDSHEKPPIRNVTPDLPPNRCVGIHNEIVEPKHKWKGKKLVNRMLESKKALIVSSDEKVNRMKIAEKSNRWHVVEPRIDHAGRDHLLSFANQRRKRTSSSPQ